ncbi:MAG: TetR/AcrR family transcriptional regulator [Lachnospiraceae bacterium]|jgi:AcrR family transcriptional regulator|nr:TetR/AcrR family transcriptional regulator [Lachnospiraceae bacterium]
MKQEEKSLLSRNKILEASGALFAEKGFDATTMQDIILRSGLSKGAIYHHFRSKEEIMQALGDKMFFDNNPFDEIRKRTDLNGLQKIRKLLKLNQSDTKRNTINMAAIPILKDPRILAAAVESNRRVLTPLWLELLEEGKADGSINTKYAKELSELLPLINFWFIPSIYPATVEEMHHKLIFVKEVLCKMGLPLMEDDDIKEMAEKFITDIVKLEG